MNVSQTTFRQALFDPSLEPPEGLMRPGNAPVGRRFDVYRNNVVAGLISALEASFPVIAKLLGPKNFRTMAAAYVRKHPPHLPLMMKFGGELPVFLSEFPPTSEIGYLPDMARQELTLRRSYHAADAGALPARALAELPVERLMSARLRMAPSLFVLRSEWPIHAIWRFNTETDAPKPRMTPETVLIGRREFDPVPYLLPPGGADCIEGLVAGLVFGDAIRPLAETDITALIGMLLNLNAITAIEEATT